MAMQGPSLVILMSITAVENDTVPDSSHVTTTSIDKIKFRPRGHLGAISDVWVLRSAFIWHIRAASFLLLNSTTASSHRLTCHDIIVILRAASLVVCQVYTTSSVTSRWITRVVYLTSSTHLVKILDLPNPVAVQLSQTSRLKVGT